MKSSVSITLVSVSQPIRPGIFLIKNSMEEWEVFHLLLKEGLWGPKDKEYCIRINQLNEAWELSKHLRWHQQFFDDFFRSSKSDQRRALHLLQAKLLNSVVNITVKSRLCTRINFVIQLNCLFFCIFMSYLLFKVATLTLILILNEVFRQDCRYTIWIIKVHQSLVL